MKHLIGQPRRNLSDWHKRNVKKWEAAVKARECPKCNALEGMWCHNLNWLDEPITTIHRERLK